MREMNARDLLRGNMELLLLSALDDGAKYGYLIQKTLHDRSDGAVSVQAGTLYPLLHKLEAESLIKSRWDDSTGRRRKWYELTAAGRRHFARQVRQWTDYKDCVERILGPAFG